MFNPAVGDSVVRERLRDRLRAAERSDRFEPGVVQALASVPLFSYCSKRELRLVAKLAKTRGAKSGVPLVVEGEHGDTMFVLLSGRATVRKGGRKLADLGPGDVIGELALLSKAPRNATVVVTADAEVAVIGRRELFRLVEDAPGFSRKLLEALANRVRDLDRRVVC
jgi:CRP-like cAMP-binding protein